LGFSPLSGIGERPDDPLMEKALHYFFENFSRLHFFKGLYIFKDKFNPRWERRYMVYPGFTSLPAITIGLARVHNNQDFD
jgi:phosphatidylglycerol lysyltransferase